MNEVFVVELSKDICVEDKFVAPTPILRSVINSIIDRQSYHVNFIKGSLKDDSFVNTIDYLAKLLKLTFLTPTYAEFLSN